jgi:threonyl-tRNA synthetase
MLLLGDQELEQSVVAVRERKSGDIGQMTLDEFKEIAFRMKKSRAISFQ